MSEPRKRVWPKIIALLFALFGGALLFICGVGFGVWFMQNFDIVPKGEMMEAVQRQLNESGGLNKLLKNTAGGAGGTQQLLEEVLKRQSAAPGADWELTPQAASSSTGPFTFRFTPGEELTYTFVANIQGEGLELVSPEPIDMDFDSGFTLTTRSVDAQGNGHLVLNFKDTAFTGDFMGSKFVMRKGEDGTELTMDGRPVADAVGLAAFPQLNYFDEPIEMQIAPNGVVRDVSGAQVEGLMAQLPLLTDLEFPEGDLEPGYQWESMVDMPVPGFGAPVRAQIVNTFTGYKKVGNRLCAVIDQQIKSEESGGNVLEAPKGFMGGLAGFSMPEFGLNGDNTVYFDVDNGQMIHSEMDMHMNMDLGKALGPQLSQTIENLGANMGELLGDLPEFEDLYPKNGGEKPGEKKKMLELDLGIKSRVSLVNPAGPPQRQAGAP